jgi:hypothetical protein
VCFDQIPLDRKARPFVVLGVDEQGVRTMPVESAFLVMVQRSIRQITGLTHIDELVAPAAACLRRAHRLHVDCTHRPERSLARIHVEGPRRARRALEIDRP